MPIDLRSNTIAHPTPAMREAMARAEVGDDVFGDDPTVARLEARVAEILGKEADVFTPSGTMADQLALRAHTEPSYEILVDDNVHKCWHRVLKVGCGVEKRQFRTSRALTRSLALDMIVAKRVLLMVRLGKDHPELPAAVVYTPDEVSVMEV